MSTDKTLFDTPFLDRESLSEEELYIKEAQNWFDQFVCEYKAELAKPGTDFEGGILLIHRALAICILNHPNTIQIVSSKTVNIQQGAILSGEYYQIQGSVCNYVLIVHSEDNFVCGIVDHNESNESNVSHRWEKFGSDQLVKSGLELVKKIQRAGLLKNLHCNKKRIGEILEKLDEQTIDDLKKIILMVKSTRQT